MEDDTESEWPTLIDRAPAANHKSVSMFKDVKNLVIEGGTFNTVEQDFCMPRAARFGKEDVRNVRGKQHLYSRGAYTLIATGQTFVSGGIWVVVGDQPASADQAGRGIEKARGAKKRRGRRGRDGKRSNEFGRDTRAAREGRRVAGAQAVEEMGSVREQENRGFSKLKDSGGA